MKSNAKNISLCLVVVLGIATAVAGCGGSDDNSSSDAPDTTSSTERSYGAPASGADDAATTTSGAATQQMKLAANPNGAISFDKASLVTNAGKSTIDFENASSVPHAVEVEGDGVSDSTAVVTGGKATLALNLKPGTYEFYCPVGDHKEDGMKGVLTVK